MGLRDDIQFGLAEAFDDDLADAVKSIVVVEYVKSYDTASGNTTSVPTPHNSRGVIEAFKSSEIAHSGGAILTGDVRCLILQNEVNIEITMSNEIHVGSDEYTIVDIESDPADATYMLQLRL